MSKINMFVIKKGIAFLLASIIPGLLFIIFILQFGLIWGTAIFVAVAIFFSLLGSRLIRHPVMSMLEGKGMLVLSYDSTGRIDMFNVQYKAPFLEGKFQNKNVTTVFDRELIHNLRVPKEGYLVDAEVVDEKGKVIDKVKVLKIPDEDEYKFGMESYFPVLIYNKNLDTFLSKTVLSDLEKYAFVKHLVLYLLKKTEELVGWMRDFGRYIIEFAKPKERFAFIKKWWFWLLIGFIVMLLIIFLLPAIGQLMGGFMSAFPKPARVP